MRKKILSGLGIGLIAAVLTVSIVLAVPSAVTNFRANPSDTSIVLTWTKGAGSTSTLINYRTDQFPTDQTSDNVTQFLAYNGTGFQTNVTGLTSGTVYFFAAWAYDGAYSDNTTLAVATLAMSLPSGGEADKSVQIPTQSLSGLNDAPALPVGFNFEPFTSIIKYFNATPNGLGMPIANVAETLAIIGITVLGILVYISSRNFFIGYAVVLALSIVGVGLDIIQGYIVGVELIIGAGVWAIDNYYQ
jgi:hypothetical protein